MGFNLMYWTPMGGFYFLVGSILPFCRADIRLVAELSKKGTGGTEC